MKTYKVVASLDYQIEADDENDAIQKAEKRLVDEIENNGHGLTEIFSFNAEEQEEINEYRLCVSCQNSLHESEIDSSGRCEGCQLQDKE